MHLLYFSKILSSPLCVRPLGLYDYPQIIKKPMDLGTVKKKIADGKYKTIANAADDVRLVWTNCMTYNADGSDFYNLAKNLNKKWEEKYSKLVADLKLGPTPMGGVLAGVDGSKISLDEKRAFAKSLYKISKEDLGKIIVEIDTKCPLLSLRMPEKTNVSSILTKYRRHSFKNSSSLWPTALERAGLPRKNQHLVLSVRAHRGRVTASFCLGPSNVRTKTIK